MLPSTTPISGSPFSEEKREDGRRHTDIRRMEFECTGVKRGEREVMEREKKYRTFDRFPESQYDDRMPHGIMNSRE